jgi:hypothetical protein
VIEKPDRKNNLTKINIPYRNHYNLSSKKVLIAI